MERIGQYIQKLFPRSPISEKPHSQPPETIDSRNLIWGYSNPEDAHDLICSICCDIYQDPVSVLPGNTSLCCFHIFCKACIERYASNPSDMCCPLCRIPWTSTLRFVPHTETERKLASIRVLCKLCGERVSYFERATHRIRCPDIMVTTPSATRCSNCDKVLPNLYERKKHEKSCSRTNTTRCPCCGKEIPMMDAFQHQRFCQYTPPTNEKAQGTRTKSSRFHQWMIAALGILAIGVSVFLAAR